MDRRQRRDPSRPNLVAVAVRLSSEAVAAVDAVAAELAGTADGLRISRSDVVRVLISEALAARAVRGPSRRKGAKPGS